MASEVADVFAAPTIQDKLSSKHREADILQVELQQANVAIRQLRLQLQAAGVADTSCVPGRLQAGNSSAAAQHLELRSFLHWLVENVNLTRQVVFECSGNEGEILVGPRRVLLKRMGSWLIETGASTAEGLKLSVPIAMHTEISSMLLAARAGGNQVSDVVLQQLADSWEIVGAEVVSAGGNPEPAIFLVHRTTSEAMIVAQWPVVDFGPRCGAASSSAFDPQQHFTRLAEPGTPALKNPVFPPPCVPSDSQKPPAATLPPPPAKELAPSPPQQMALTSSQSMLRQENSQAVLASEVMSGLNAITRGEAGSQALPRPNVNTGDRVEVKYQGQWLIGVLERVDGDMAKVKCDEDRPWIITVAPLTSVRPAREGPQHARKQAFKGHARARSVG